MYKCYGPQYFLLMASQDVHVGDSSGQCQVSAVIFVSLYPYFLVNVPVYMQTIILCADAYNGMLSIG